MHTHWIDLCLFKDHLLGFISASFPHYIILYGSWYQHLSQHVSLTHVLLWQTSIQLWQCSLTVPWTVLSTNFISWASCLFKNLGFPRVTCSSTISFQSFTELSTLFKILYTVVKPCDIYLLTKLVWVQQHCQLQTISSLEILLLSVNSSFLRQLWLIHVTYAACTVCFWRWSWVQTLVPFWGRDYISISSLLILFFFLTFKQDIYFMISIIQSRNQKVQSGIGNIM